MTAPLSPDQRLVRDALADLLHTLGYVGGVLVCVRPDGQSLLLAAHVPDDATFSVADVLGAALLGVQRAESAGQT